MARIKAFVYAVVDGRDTCGTYSSNEGRGAFVTNAYASLSNLIKFGLRDMPPGIYHIEGFYDWGNRYGKPDVDVKVSKGGRFPGDYHLEYGPGSSGI